MARHTSSSFSLPMRSKHLLERLAKCRPTGAALTIVRSVKTTLIASIIIATSVLSLGACNLDAYPCRGPYGEPCGGPRSGWPGAVTCPSC